MLNADDRELTGPTLALVEAEVIRASWTRLKGNHGRMARELGIAKSTLLRKLRELGLRPEAPVAPAQAPAPAPQHRRWIYSRRSNRRVLRADRVVPGGSR